MKDEEQREEKQPIDMTTDEALDYVFAPEIVAELKKKVAENDAEPEDSNGDCV